eukprot:314810_1
MAPPADFQHAQTYKIVLFTLELIIIWGIIPPCLIYYTLLYYKVRNEPQLSKRHTTLVIVTSMCCICYTTFGRTISILRSSIAQGDHITIRIFDTIMWIASMFTLLNILFIRSFTLNFKIRYNMITAEGLWIKHISSKSTEQVNWYYAHRNTIGNVNWMMKRIFIPVLLF